MSLKIIVMLGYAIFLLVGAIFGLKAGSKVSLYMGLASSAIAASGIFIYQQNSVLGNVIFIVLTGLLSIVFLIRVLKTKKMLPSGMLLSVSVLMLLLNILLK